jgi:hypothetical protein
VWGVCSAVITHRLLLAGTLPCRYTPTRWRRGGLIKPRLELFLGTWGLLRVGEVFRVHTLYLFGIFGYLRGLLLVFFPLVFSSGVSLFGLSKTFSGYGVSRVSRFWKKTFM